MTTSDHCRCCGRLIPALPHKDAFCVACRYSDPPPAKRWDAPDQYGKRVVDDEGRTIADAQPFIWHREPPLIDPATGERRDRDLEVVRGFLRLLTRDGNPLLAGQILFVLAYLCNETPCTTQAELANLLNISASRVSQILGEIPKEFASLSRLKHRTRVAHSSR